MKRLSDLHYADGGVVDGGGFLKVVEIVDPHADNLGEGEEEEIENCINKIHFSQYVDIISK